MPVAGGNHLYESGFAGTVPAVAGDPFVDGAAVTGFARNNGSLGVDDEV